MPLFVMEDALSLDYVYLDLVHRTPLEKTLETRVPNLQWRLLKVHAELTAVEWSPTLNHPILHHYRNLSDQADLWHELAGSLVDQVDQDTDYADQTADWVFVWRPLLQNDSQLDYQLRKVQ